MSTFLMTEDTPEPWDREACENTTRALVTAPHTLWQAIAARFARKSLLRKLSRHDPHLLRDMGFDPSEVYGEFEGTLYELHGDCWRRM